MNPAEIVKLLLQLYSAGSDLAKRYPQRPAYEQPAASPATPESDPAQSGAPSVPPGMTPGGAPVNPYVPGPEASGMDPQIFAPAGDGPMRAPRQGFPPRPGPQSAAPVQLAGMEDFLQQLLQVPRPGPGSQGVQASRQLGRDQYQRASMFNDRYNAARNAAPPPVDFWGTLGFPRGVTFDSMPIADRSLGFPVQEP